VHGSEYNSGSADEAPEHSSHFGACLRGEAGASRLTLHIPDPRDVSVLSPSNCITARAPLRRRRNSISSPPHPARTWARQMHRGRRL